MRALRDFNIPKIVTDDLPVFMGLIGDLFPALDVPRKRDLNFEKVGGRSWALVSWELPGRLPAWTGPFSLLHADRQTPGKGSRTSLGSPLALPAPLSAQVPRGAGWGFGQHQQQSWGTHPGGGGWLLSCPP